MSEQIKESPKGELEQGEFKMKKKRGRPKKLTVKEEPTKLDFKKQEEEAIATKNKEIQDAIQREKTKSVQSTGSDRSEERNTTEVEVPQSEKEKEIGVIEEITSEESNEPEIDNSTPQEVKQPQLPENIEKLVDFMKETGGDMEDYIRLNADYSNVNTDDLLREYYKKSKPHLTAEEVDFVLEDKFAYDPDLIEEKEAKKKQLEYKEEIVKAKSFLEDLKSKYYEEVKLRPGVTQEQRKALDFFNKYNEEQEIANKRHNRFKLDTKKFFNQEFKGFEYNLGEKRFRYNVNDTDNVSDSQSNLNNFVGKFLDEKGEVSNYGDYHKAIFTALNADSIANHFYEQGKADAIKDVTARSKNISNEPRATSSGDVYIGGLKVKAISGVDSSKLKVRINKKK